MELELKLSKPDNSCSWGFRVVGGADFQQPLIVVKVHEEGWAEKSGLAPGDIITKINDNDCSTLTHLEAHDLIATAGLKFTLKIRRGDSVPENLLQDEGREIEVRDVQVFVDEEIIDKAENLAQLIGKEIFTGFEQHKSAPKTKPKKMVYSNSTQTFIATEEKIKQKQWSTFLMKPDRPQPKPRKTAEEIKTESDPYKVVIKKQTRRKSLPKEKRVQFDQNIIEVEIESLSSHHLESDPEYSTSPDSQYQQDLDSLEENTYNKFIGENYENDYEEEVEYKDDFSYSEENETDFDNQLRINESLEVKCKPITEIIIDDPNTENVVTLAEQLKALQKQLEALSLLPSEVQPTLDAVSKQLASLVNNDVNEDVGNEEKQEEDNQNSVSVDAEAAETIEDEDGSVIGEELEEDSIEDELQAILDRSNLEDEVKETHEDLVNEEELEERRKEEELLATRREMYSDIIRNSLNSCVNYA